MDFEVILSTQAIEQLDEIAAWIERDNPKRVRSSRSELFDRAQELSKFPSLGSPLRTSSRIRKLIFGNYLDINEINQAHRRVEVISFRHGSRKIRMRDLGGL